MKETFVSREIQDIQKLLKEYENLKTYFRNEESTGVAYWRYVTVNGCCITLCVKTGLIQSLSGEPTEADILAAQRLLSIKRQLQSYKRQYSEA